MADTDEKSDPASLPDEIAAHIEPHYIDAFGTLPPVPKLRIETGAELAPEYTALQEEMRARALFSDVFDNKTSQLFALCILSAHGGPGPYWHARAARRYGARWEELYKAVEISAFFNGFDALMQGGGAVGRLWQEEKEAGTA